MHDDVGRVAPVADDPDPQPTPTFLVAGVGVALLVVIVLLLEVLYYRTAAAEMHRKVVAEQPLELRTVQAQQLELLSRYRWVDAASGVTAVPIDHAIDLVVAEAERSSR